MKYTLVKVQNVHYVLTIEILITPHFTYSESMQRDSNGELLSVTHQSTNRLDWIGFIFKLGRPLA